jgi:hypothetical protein
MIRSPGIVLCLCAAASVFAVEGKPAGDKSATATLELELPASAAPPSHAKERVAKLEIDGKSYGSPKTTRVSREVPLKKGAASVTVVYTFWPNVYTRIIRTKSIKVEPGKIIKASFSKADEGSPDKIWVIYVPTPPEVVEAMCKLAKIGKDDVVHDIGCGDGRLVIHAVKKFGAKKGVGIDLLAERIKECKENAKKNDVEDKVTFLEKDAFNTFALFP